uniref:Uncharacterized protein n=1 Tax=Oryza sativa subsp. japonica TaxID=39947 RepID=Q5VSB4_ORYSJ|nr:hypothetical protein [Oryza sativa Japonica Group]
MWRRAAGGSQHRWQAVTAGGGMWCRGQQGDGIGGGVRAAVLTGGSLARKLIGCGLWAARRRSARAERRRQRQGDANKMFDEMRRGMW